jgi:hypothetical protein
MEEQQVVNGRITKESDYNSTLQENLPNAKTVLVLGILSIIFSSWYFALIGAVLSIFALVMANRDLAAYHSDTAKYTLSSLNNLKAGRVCAMIGLSVAILFFIMLILILAGIFTTWPFWGMID